LFFVLIILTAGFMLYVLLKPPEHMEEGRKAEENGRVAER